MNTKIDSSNVRFNGRIGIYKNHKFTQKLQSSRHSASLILNQDLNDIVALTKHAGENKMCLLDRLVDLYNERNFYRTEKKEPSTLVNSIYKNIKKSTHKHYSIISRFQGSLEEMNRVFSSIQNNSKKLDFAYTVNKDVLQGYEPINTEILPQLLESENYKYYYKNYPKIKSYLYLNKNNKNAVPKLDEMINAGTFNPEKYDSALKLHNIEESFPFKETPGLNKKMFLEYYTPERQKFTEELINYFNRMDSALEAGGDVYIADMYKSTTPKNLDFRVLMLKKNRNNFLSVPDEKKAAVLKDIDTIMQMADKDKHVKSYVSKVMQSPQTAYNNIAEMKEVLQGVSSKKLDIFKDNADNIISITRGQERIKALNEEISNPFFETPVSRRNTNRLIKYGFKKRPTIFSKTSLYIKNLMLKALDKFTKDSEAYVVDIPQPKIAVITAKPEIVPVVAKEEPKEVVLEAPKTMITAESTPKISKNRDFTSDVIQIVKNKLGPKTFEKQREAFGINATKMRLNMLPEIFASVAETRKTDRAVGKRRINSSNKDVLNLYLKINSNNKKLVNYMLKKRNVDNTRMFEIKDIIAVIDKAEAKIKSEKNLNPNYRARDARRYYNHLQASKIQQYGKLTRKETLWTKA